MTGLAPDTTRVYDLQRHFRESLPNVVTLGQAFQKNDYYVARVGKIYHYGNPGQIGTNGLDDEPTWNRRINPAGVDKTKEEPLVTNHTPARTGLGSAAAFYASPASDLEHTDGMVATEIIRLMEENNGKPWFLGAGILQTALPVDCPVEVLRCHPARPCQARAVRRVGDADRPEVGLLHDSSNWGMTEKQRLESMRAYYATILFLDAQVGRLTAALKRLRQEENTTICFWGDHGYGLGEHGQWMKQTVLNTQRAPH